MVVGKLNLVILATAVGGVLWIEHGNRIKIEPPTEAAEHNVAVCPENESVPFSADCMKFIQGGVGSAVHLREIVVDGAESPELP